MTGDTRRETRDLGHETQDIPDRRHEGHDARDTQTWEYIEIRARCDVQNRKYEIGECEIQITR